jgi:S-DNA-T family DNA segregation ATPase FtsK/SpoIIIE
LAQARKKAIKKVSTPSRLTHHLRESVFLLSILVAVYLVACLFTYDPNDPGPFNTTNSDHVQNAGRVLGAWIADAFLGLTGYIAYLLPLIIVYGGWRVWTKKPAASETGVIEAVAIVTGFALFILSSTGLSFMHLLPSAGSMPAGGGGVIGDVVATPIWNLTGLLGSTLFLFSMSLVGITLFTGISLPLICLTGYLRTLPAHGTGLQVDGRAPNVRKSGKPIQFCKKAERHPASNRRLLLPKSVPVSGLPRKSSGRYSRICRLTHCRRWICWMNPMTSHLVTAKRTSKHCPSKWS